MQGRGPFATSRVRLKQPPVTFPDRQTTFFGRAIGKVDSDSGGSILAQATIRALIRASITDAVRD